MVLYNKLSQLNVRIVLDFNKKIRSHCNILWSCVSAETLSRSGVEHVVVSPGSRSTPLVYAFTKHSSIKTIPVLDERSAAFFALGLAKQTHRPVALVCTSGTATVNYYPAIVEAFYSKAPLIVLTADRPPELQDCHEGQAINQKHLYGAYVRSYIDLGIPEASVPALKKLVSTLGEGLGSISTLPGPVHLNYPFREPLIFDGSVSKELISKKSITGLLSKITLSKKQNFNSKNDCLSHIVEKFTACEKGIIIAGPIERKDSKKYSKAVIELSKVLGWPVFADALSPLRFNQGNDNCIIGNYADLLKQGKVSNRQKPSIVLSLGPLPVNKLLRKWLADVSPKLFTLNRYADEYSPLLVDNEFVHSDVFQFLKLFKNVKPVKSPDYLEAWTKKNQVAASLSDRFFSKSKNLTEEKTAWLVSKYLPEKTPVFVSNSLPVRMMESCARSSNQQYKVHFNRGASGIDGILSTALGVSYENRPSVLLVGDLTFLHDCSALRLQEILKGHLTIILVNNNGGRIFEKLPVAKSDIDFEKYFVMPQNVDIQKLCQAHFVEHVKVGGGESLKSLIQKLPSKGIRVLEVIPD
jgi:2-succinyl-5-enolpyruvyl-6-hydroxy-3-cyclohexene-1-carboxylate synthase